MIPIRYNVRSLAVRKATTLATALGIALVVFVLASSLMLSAGIHKTLGSSGKVDNAIVLRMGSDAELGSVIEESSVPLILAAPGVKTDSQGKPLGTSEIVVVAAMPKVGADGVTNVTIRGVSEGAEGFRPELKVVAGRPPKPGADEVMIGSRIQGRIVGLDLGQTLELKKNRPVTVVGVFEAGGSSYESEIWADSEVVRQAFHREGIYSIVRVQLESPTKFDAFRAGVENDKRLGLQALRETTFYEKQSEGVSTFVGVLGTSVSIFFAAGAMIGAMITMYGAVASRQREIGTLRALGFSRSSVLFSFLIEAVLLSLVGGAAGAAASMMMGFVHFSMINMASWSEMVFSFDPTPRVLTTALVFACGMGLFGGLLPAVRAARTSPLKAIRG
ncbi:MAG TPA: FtsX-like permease family protein [Polyangiaceae bacterium]|jgi:putative ABC transport system permease protein|nr:FtsX-like permease family protein [Polyangiaceae bacterium]